MASSTQKVIISYMHLVSYREMIYGNTLWCNLSEFQIIIVSDRNYTQQKVKWS